MEVWFETCAQIHTPCSAAQIIFVADNHVNIFKKIICILQLQLCIIFYRFQVYSAVIRHLYNL